MKKVVLAVALVAMMVMATVAEAVLVNSFEEIEALGVKVCQHYGSQWRTLDFGSRTGVTLELGQALLARGTASGDVEAWIDKIDASSTRFVELVPAEIIGNRGGWVVSNLDCLEQYNRYEADWKRSATEVRAYLEILADKFDLGTETDEVKVFEVGEGIYDADEDDGETDEDENPLVRQGRWLTRRNGGEIGGIDVVIKATEYDLGEFTPVIDELLALSGGYVCNTRNAPGVAEYHAGKAWLWYQPSKDVDKQELTNLLERLVILDRMENPVESLVSGSFYLVIPRQLLEQQFRWYQTGDRLTLDDFERLSRGHIWPKKGVERADFFGSYQLPWIEVYLPAERLVLPVSVVRVEGVELFANGEYFYNRWERKEEQALAQVVITAAEGKSIGTIKLTLDDGQVKLPMSVTGRLDGKTLEPDFSADTRSAGTAGVDAQTADGVATADGETATNSLGCNGGLGGLALLALVPLRRRQR